MATILEDVKRICNVPAAETSFDAELLLHANSVISDMQRLGVNNIETFLIESGTGYPALTEGDGLELDRLVQIYIPLKVKIVFDPSTSASVAQAHNTRIAELEMQIMQASSEEVIVE